MAERILVLKGQLSLVYLAIKITHYYYNKFVLACNLIIRGWVKNSNNVAKLGGNPIVSQ